MVCRNNRAVVSVVGQKAAAEKMAAFLNELEAE